MNSTRLGVSSIVRSISYLMRAFLSIRIIASI